MVRSRQSTTVQAQSEAALPKRLWTIDEVAEFLHVGKSTVRRMMRDSALPYFQDEDTLRFDPRKIDIWVASRTKSA